MVDIAHKMMTKTNPTAVIPAQKYNNFSKYSCIGLLYTNYSILSISLRLGIELAVPILVVDSPAVALANAIASFIF